jgi:hypothetical protein
LSQVQTLAEESSMYGRSASVGAFFWSQAARTPSSLNCGDRSRVGWQRSKATSPAFSFAICSSFWENNVLLTVIPVFAVKSGKTGSGHSSDHISRLSSPGPLLQPKVSSDGATAASGRPAMA